jgi:FkbM family methyltransferase
VAGSWRFRSGTLDRMIFNDVVSGNEYQLPDRFAASDIVIDGGAHIGCFAHAVVMRGGETVWSIEPDPANCAIAAEHLRTFVDKGFVRLMQGALWRSDPNDDELRFDGYHAFPRSYSGMEGILNTGNGSVVWGVGEPVAKIAFDELVDAITGHGERRVRLLKLDCEGAEWPIVLTSRRLHLIDEICGEFHEIGGPFPEISEDRPSKQPIFCTGQPANYTIDELVRVLSEAGFAVTWRRHRRPTGALEGLGLFFAKRPAA